jgi:antitoxin (DNA-binding transcriptional repressor) of toxin-antitoxin stability system
VEAYGIRRSGVSAILAPGVNSRRPSTNFAHTRGRLTPVASRSYLRSMRAVGLKVLKNKLSEYVRIVASGETVLVTDRDHVVAELIPPRHGRSVGVADALLADAVRNGWITAPVLSPDAAPPRAPVARLDQLLGELAADRQER